MKECDLIVDAIFGTGLTKEVRATGEAVIEEMNASGKPVIASTSPPGSTACGEYPSGSP